MTLGCTSCIPKCTSGVSPARNSPWTTRSIWGTWSIPRTWCWWRRRWWTTALPARCGPVAATWVRCSISPVLTIYMLMCLSTPWWILKSLRHFLAYISSNSTLGFSPLWLLDTGTENVVLKEGLLKPTWGQVRRHKPRGFWDHRVQQVYGSSSCPRSMSQTGWGR